MLALDPRVVDAVWAGGGPTCGPAAPTPTHWVVTGCSWDVAARLSVASETTLRAGVFDKVLEEAIAAYDRIIGLDLPEVAVDGSLHKAPCGGEGTGPNPTDRAKTGWKWSVATDRWGIPIDSGRLRGLGDSHLLAHQLKPDLVLLRRREKPLHPPPVTLVVDHENVLPNHSENPPNVG